MKKILLLFAIGGTLLSASLVNPSCGGSAATGPDTLKINTTELGAEIIGFNGPTPVEISVYKGVITDIEVLPNHEGPMYLQMVLESGLIQKLIGKTLEEARQESLDAVTGATFTSTALIQNIELGLANGGASKRNSPGNVNNPSDK